MLQMMAELDGRILLFIQEFLRFEWLNPIVLFLTSLGNAGVIWIVLAVLFLIQKKYQKTGIAMTIALLLGLLVTNILLKNWVCRPRPYVAIPQLNALVTAADWSFPSGHSTSSMAAALVIFCRTPRRLPKTGKRSRPWGNGLRGGCRFTGGFLAGKRNRPYRNGCLNRQILLES